MKTTRFSTIAAMALACAAAGAAPIDDARQYAARSAQMRCEMVTLQLEALGAGVGTEAQKNLSTRLEARIAEMERELAPARERVYAQRDALSPEQFEGVRSASAATISDCTAAASAAYRARVEAGTAAPPTTQPNSVVPYRVESREKTLLPEARQGSIQGQPPAQ